MGGRARARSGNLPAELTTFVGRRRQLQDVKAGLSASRLLTLVGPGGVGKTRLALQVSKVRCAQRQGAAMPRVSNAAITAR